MPGKKNKEAKKHSEPEKKQTVMKEGGQAAENAPEIMAGLQKELLSKITAMKEGLMGGGEGTEMFEGLFKSLLGDLGGSEPDVSKQAYLDSEPQFQERMAEIDTTLASKNVVTQEIDTMYERILAHQLEEVKPLDLEDPPVDLTPSEEKQLLNTDK